MKRLPHIFQAVVVFFLMTSIEVTAQAGQILNPFDTLQYDQVIAYDYDGQANNPIVKDSQLIKRGYHGQIYGQTELTKMQIAVFHKIIGDTATYGGMTAACFDPHMGIVYYKQGKIVGYISVCISCNYLLASMPMPVSEVKKKYIDKEKTILTSLYGFSQSAREKLNNFCKELKFTTCWDNLEHHLFYKN